MGPGTFPPIFLTKLHHASHTSHSRGTTSHRFFFFREFCNKGFGSQDHTGDRCRILEGNALNLSRIDGLTTVYSGETNRKPRKLVFWSGLPW